MNKRARKQRSKATREGMTVARNNLRRISGKIPFGWEQDQDGKLQRHRQEQQVIEQIETWVKRKWTLRKIAATLNERQIPSKTGGQWYHATVAKVRETNVTYKRAQSHYMAHGDTLTEQRQYQQARDALRKRVIKAMSQVAATRSPPATVPTVATPGKE
jgi:hypothetical protein